MAEDFSIQLSAVDGIGDSAQRIGSDTSALNTFVSDAHGAAVDPHADWAFAGPMGECTDAASAKVDQLGEAMAGAGEKLHASVAEYRTRDEDARLTLEKAWGQGN